MILAPVLATRAPSNAVRRLFALLLLALLCGCAPTGPGVRPDAAADDPAALAAQGRHAEAAEAWLARARSNPDAAFRARLNAAGQWLAAGRSVQARELIERLRADAPDREAAFELDLLRAELALFEGDIATAQRLLAGTRERVPEALRDRFDALAERLAARDPDSPPARIEALADALGEPSFRPETALALLVDLPSATLERLARRFASRPALVPWLDLAASIRPMLTDDPALAAALADWRDRYGFEPGLGQRLHEWIRAWRQTRPLPASLAVLLPGEGTLERVARVLRDGLLAEWLTLAPERRPTLEFVYVEDGEQAAARAWASAVADGAQFVVGPLPRGQIEAVIRRSDASTPTLLLNRPPDGVALPGREQPVAVLALPPEEEAELAAIRALVQRHDRALVIAEDSDYGRRVADRFVETFTLGGGRVLAEVAYDAEAFDHTEALSQLLGIDRSERRIGALREVLAARFEAVPQRRTDFDVVFLAARGGAGLQLMPQLRFLGVETLPIYSTSDIYPGGEIGSDLDGVQFAAAPWLLADGPAAERRRRAESLLPGIEDSPTLSTLHALGRDAMALVPWLGAMKRDPALYLAGNGGRLRLADGIVLERDLPWAVIDDGRLVRFAAETDG